MKVRKAKHEDINIISNVLAASWKTAYRGIVNDEYLDLIPSDHWVDFLDEGMNKESMCTMVLEDNQAIVGVAILFQDEKERIADLISFYLLPDKIGKGFGHYFYCKIENELRDIGISTCILDVLEDNERAIRFYESHGFINTEKIIKATLGNRDYFCKVYEKII